MSHIMAIDQGTSSSRVIIFDLQGREISVAQYEFDMTFPADGWVEQDPEVIWQTTLRAGRDSLSKAGLSGADITAIGITNQRETTLVWDRDSGESLHNAIVWQDRRTSQRCADMRADGMQIYIGEESGYERLDHCSLVTAPYEINDQVAGVLGVVGPTRMAYDRVIPIVDITAKLLGAALKAR